jgi:Protein of unknown function (DUF3072)
MAKSYARRWNGWRTDLVGGEIKDRVPRASSKPKAKPKSMTNAQAKYLASLKRDAGERYSSGLTRKQASDEIKRLLAKKKGARANGRA